MTGIRRGENDVLAAVFRIPCFLGPNRVRLLTKTFVPALFYVRNMFFPDFFPDNAPDIPICAALPSQSEQIGRSFVLADPNRREDLERGRDVEAFVGGAGRRPCGCCFLGGLRPRWWQRRRIWRLRLCPRAFLPELWTGVGISWCLGLRAGSDEEALWPGLRSPGRLRLCARPQVQVIPFGQNRSKRPPAQGGLFLSPLVCLPGRGPPRPLTPS